VAHARHGHRGARVRLSRARPAAGKTGTTSDGGRTWFVGYTPGRSWAAVWMGLTGQRRSWPRPHGRPSGRARWGAAPDAHLRGRQGALAWPMPAGGRGGLVDRRRACAGLGLARPGSGVPPTRELLCTVLIPIPSGHGQGRILDGRRWCRWPAACPGPTRKGMETACRSKEVRKTRQLTAAKLVRLGETGRTATEPMRSYTAFVHRGPSQSVGTSPGRRGAPSPAEVLHTDAGARTAGARGGRSSEPGGREARPRSAPSTTPSPGNGLSDSAIHRRGRLSNEGSRSNRGPGAGERRD